MTIEQALDIIKNTTPEQIDAINVFLSKFAPMFLVISWIIIEIISRLFNGTMNYIERRKNKNNEE